MSSPHIMHMLFLCGLLPQCPHLHLSQYSAISALSMVFLLSMLPHSNLLSILLFTGVLAAELDIGVTHVGHSLTALLVTGVHAVSVSITAPPQRDAQPIQPALELITVAATGRPCGCRGTGRGYWVRVGAQVSHSHLCLPNPADAKLSLRL